MTRDWSVPHFEKMLEDNAKLLALLTHAFQVTQQEPLFKAIQTLTAYVDSTLSDHMRGGFYGSQDADEHHYALPLTERAKLPAPYVDHTFYTDWNAMMVSALLLPLPEREKRDGNTFALGTLERIWHEMYRADAGLFHFAREGDAPQLLNQLSDLAHATRAFLDVYQTTGDILHLQRAQIIADLALAELYDTDAGGFWSEPRTHESLGLLRLPDKSLNENAGMADALTLMYRLTGDEKYHAPAERSLAFFVPTYARYGFMAAGYALAVDHWLNEPVTIHIVGAANDARTCELHAGAFAEYAPAKIVQLLDPARDTARLAQLGYPVSHTPLAYVCVGQKCLTPVGDAKGIGEGIREFAG